VIVILDMKDILCYCKKEISVSKLVIMLLVADGMGRKCQTWKTLHLFTYL